MEVDYLILGAGITGLSCATWLNHLGKNKILIMDRDHTRSAFSRNAGFLTSGSAQFALSLKQRFGVDKAKELWELTNSNHDELSQFIHRHKLEHKIGFRKAGSVTLLDRELTVSELDFLGQLGIQAIDQTFFDCASAFYDPWEASFDSFLFIKEWERALLEKGVALLKEDVVEVSRAKGLWLINDKLKAKNLIIANNRSSSFLPKEYAHFHPMIQAVRAQMIEVDAPKGFKHHANFYLPEEKVYFRLSNDRLILGGKRLVDEEAEYTEDFGSNPSITRALLDTAYQLFKEKVEVSREWSGIMGFSALELPIIRVEKNLVWMGGFSGHGNGFAFKLAQLAMRDLIGDAIAPESIYFFLKKTKNFGINKES